MPYRVKKEFLKFPQLRTSINGKVVSLISAFTYEKSGTPTKAPKTVHVPLASQSELKAIFERGDNTVERYEEEKAQPTAKKQEIEPLKVELKEDEHK
jgi:hypothetical protein